MNKQVIFFTSQKPTKNTVKFEEEGDGAHAVGTLYVQKHVLGENPPKRLKVTIEKVS